MVTILSSLSFTLGETILINVLFWLIIICVVILLIWSLRSTKDDDSDDYDGRPKRTMMFH